MWNHSLIVVNAVKFLHAINVQNPRKLLGNLFPRTPDFQCFERKNVAEKRSEKNNSSAISTYFMSNKHKFQKIDKLNLEKT